MAINLVTQPSRSCASEDRIAARTAVTTVARKRSIRCYSETRIRNPCVRSKMESCHHIHRHQPAANEYSSLLINLSIDCSDSREIAATPEIGGTGKQHGRDWGRTLGPTSAL